MEITDDEIREILEYCGKATPGEWANNGNGVHVGVGCVAITYDRREENAAFIANAKRDLPRLATALREARNCGRSEREHDPMLCNNCAECLYKRWAKADAETTRLHARIAELEAQRDSLQMQVESETYSKCFTDTNVGDD